MKEARPIVVLMVVVAAVIIVAMRVGIKFSVQPVGANSGGGPEGGGENGDAAREFRLGISCLARNPVLGVQWLRKAADRNYAPAEYYLANLYYFGEDMTQDYAQAMTLYRKAADAGLAQAQYALGRRYEDGNGVVADASEAVNWYHKAADQNEPNAENQLGNCYANGVGVDADEEEAVKWYRLAAGHNYAEAQYNLGLCYLNGQGVVTNEAEGVKWYRKAVLQMPTRNWDWAIVTKPARVCQRITVWRCNGIVKLQNRETPRLNIISALVILMAMG